MSVQWVAVQSFQHSQDLLTAINALSIHLKLAQAGIIDTARHARAEEARATLRSFLAELEPIITEVEGGAASPVLGADPRLRELARSFATARRSPQWFHSALFRDTFNRVRQLLDSHRPEDREPLLECLNELRVLIEEHIHTDTEQVLGEF
jgi:hypothetical protein